MQQRIDSYTHKEEMPIHTENTSKKETYKCSKEQIHTNMKNTFIDIQRIQVNKTHTNVAKINAYTHEEDMHTHTNNTSKHDTYQCSKEYIHIHMKNTSK